MSQTCPYCGLLSPDSAPACDCGYDFRRARNRDSRPLDDAATGDSPACDDRSPEAVHRREAVRQMTFGVGWWVAAILASVVCSDLSIGPAIPAGIFGIGLIWFFQGLFRYVSGPSAGAGRRLGCGRDAGSGLDLSWLHPPDTMVDGAAWDRYWENQLKHRVLGFSDIFLHDGDLVDAMRSNGFRTVLCVGSGVSLEPHALAWVGFEVTVLDLSAFAMRLAGSMKPPENVLSRHVGERRPEVGGSATFVAGDLCDSECCPGPYDVVIERCTLQLYPDAERPAAIRAVANRLAARGILISQTHDGAWKPPAPRRHGTQAWFDAEGWPRWQRGEAVTTRTAWLATTTG